jgi:formiminotetrahydrofolate cyclodeaminase
MRALLARPRGSGEKGLFMLAKMTLEQFVESLSSATPTPGGGSAAALAGATAASLVVMVCDLTIGREKYRDHDVALRTIRDRAAGLRKDLIVLVDRDAEAFDAVMAARRRPKGTSAEARDRDAALAAATLFATEIPLATAEACSAVMQMAVETARKGNVNAASDSGTAALLAYAGLRAGVMNVRTNLKGIEDPARLARMRDRVRRLEVEAERQREEALAAVFSRINGA